jgi:hypothetical protein
MLKKSQLNFFRFNTYNFIINKSFDYTINKIVSINETANQNDLYNIYNQIIIKYKPVNILLGNFNNDLYNKIHNEINNENNNKNINIYTPILNRKSLLDIIDKPLHTNNNFTYNTSFSNTYIKKHNLIDIAEIKHFNKLFNINTNRVSDPNIRIYINCFTDCPYEGKLKNVHIIFRLLEIMRLTNNKVCLVDTLGTLQLKDLEYILTLGIYYGLKIDQIALQLNVKEGNVKRIEKIMFYALDNGISEFDVVANFTDFKINTKELYPMDYELYNWIITNYMINKNNI